MIILPEEKKIDQIYFLSENSCFKLLEQSYIETRRKEGRIYSDEALIQLPSINRNHALYFEWKIREAYTKPLIKYFSAYKGLDIIDLGCGNGWLANQLSSKTDNYVYALDINKLELEQGARVFSGNKRLQFIYADIFENILPQNSFDAVIISSAVQYFNEPALLIERLFNLLNISGEIHITGSNFYKDRKLKGAVHRTESYYKKLGHPEMIKFYHHHTWKDLKEFKYQIINQANFKVGKIFNKIFRANFSPFPWIRIKAKDNF